MTEVIEVPQDSTTTAPTGQPIEDQAPAPKPKPWEIVKPVDFFLATDNPTATYLKPELFKAIDAANLEGEKIAKVRNAKDNALAAVETSDSDEAVSYREARDALNEVRRLRDAEREAMLKQIEEALTAKYAKLPELEGNEKVLLETAQQVEVKNTVTGYDTSQATKNWEAAVGVVKGLAAAIKSVAEGFSISVPQVTTVTRGHTGTTSQDKSWRPKFDRIVVNGKEIQGVEKDGKIGYPTMTEAKKIAGMGSDLITKALETKVGGRKDSADEWAPVLEKDGENAGSVYFTVGLKGTMPYAEVRVWPRSS